MKAIKRTNDQNDLTVIRGATYRSAIALILTGIEEGFVMPESGYKVMTEITWGILKNYNPKLEVMVSSMIEKRNTRTIELQQDIANPEEYAEKLDSESEKIKQIENIQYEYNSWSLRDTTGFSQYLESCKKLGREVLEASIEELEIMGLPPKTSDSPGTINIKIILDALDDELKGSQYKAMMKLLKTPIGDDEKSRQLNDIIKELDSETIMAIFKGIMLHNDFIGALPEG